VKRVSFFVTSLLSDDHYHDSIKRDVGKCGMRDRRQKCIQDFNDNTHFEYPGGNARIVAY
jgi:hypothetical protein